MKASLADCEKYSSASFFPMQNCVLQDSCGPRGSLMRPGRPFFHGLPGLVARLFLAAALVPAARTSAAEPPNWPQFRGASAAGQEGRSAPDFPGPPARWAWSVELPGRGNASPVVWGDRAFVVSAQDTDGSKVISCHAVLDGRLLWSDTFPGSLDRLHAWNSLATSSPAVDGERVYWMRHADGEVHVEALGHDGRRLWSRRIGPFTAEHGFGASPAVWRDLLIVPHDDDAASCIVAVDTATGAERWRIPRQSAKASYATPLVVDADPPVVIVASMAHGFTAIDPRDGSVRWERRCFAKRTVSSPVLVASPDVALLLGSCGEGSGDNTLVAIRMPTALRGAAPSDPPAIAWQLDRSASPYVPTPLAAASGIVLWGDRGVVTCVDPATGAIRWKGRAGGDYSASPIRVGATIVNVSAAGEIVAIADAGRFEVVGRLPLGETSRATPAVAGGRVFFRGERTLRAVVLTPPSADDRPTGTSR